MPVRPNPGTRAARPAPARLRRALRYAVRRPAVRLRAWYAALRVGAKIDLLPVVATAGFAGVLAVAVGLGVATQRHLARLERECYPALEASRRLRDVVEATQGALLTAVVAGDTGRIAAADSLAREFAAALDAPAAAPSRGRLRREYAAYFASARRATVALVTQETGDEALTAIRAMVGRYNGLRAELAARLAGDARVIDAEFRTTRTLQTAMWAGVVGTAALALGALAALARLATRGIVRPLGAAIAVARRLAAEGGGPSDGAEGGVTFPAAGRDEVGQLLRALRAMLAHLRSADGALRAREARFRALVEQSSDATLVLDADARVRYASDSTLALYGAAPARLVGRRAAALVHREDAPAALAAFRGVLASPRAAARLSYRVRRAGGGWRTIEAVATNRLDEPAIAGVVLNTRDVTERAALEAQLAHQAFHDPLTGLANRALFRDRAERALARGARSGRGAAVLYLDLDDFKTVNDSLGHAAGDALLGEVAARLLHATRGADTVARLGGDEFAVLLDDVRTAEDATAVARRVLGALAAPVDALGTPVTVGASVGVALSRPDDGPHELLRNADVAMYLAKRRGKRHFELFAPEMHDAAVARLALEADVRHALAGGEPGRRGFRLVYQPIVALPSGGVAGFEALVRWEHPERGPVSPAELIPVAEETGLIVPLGRWVLAEACRQAAAWRREPGAGGGLLMSVNVSGRQLAEGDALVEDVRAALAGSGLAPGCLQLEITETVMMHDTDAALAVLGRLTALGVRIAVDDFGTGYSSLSYLERFPVDTLKIDKAFVGGLGRGGEESPLAEAIVRIGRTLGLRVVAEGIETAPQAARLAEFGCGYGQGYLFARPLPPEEAGRALRPGAAGAAAWRPDG